MHKIAANVERQCPALAAVFLTFILDVLLQSLDAVVGASALNATI